jgi:GNAT superfamily N-acetyltransferase
LRERVAALVEDEWPGSGLRYLRGWAPKAFFLWRRVDGLLSSSIEVLGHVHLGEASSNVQAAHGEIGIGRVGNVATVSGLVVAKGSRGHGLGSALMAAAELDAGGGHFYLSAAGAAAVRFYIRRCSYEVLPHSKHLSRHFSTDIRSGATCDVAATAVEVTWMHKFREPAATAGSESPLVLAANLLLAELHAERAARANQHRPRYFVGSDAETIVKYHHVVPVGRPPPPGFDSRPVRVHDGRCEAHTLDTTGFELITGFLRPDLLAEMARANDVHAHIRTVVYPAIAALLRARLGVRAEIIPFDHVLRRGVGTLEPDASVACLGHVSTEPPIAAVHNDYTVRSGYTRARAHLEAHASEAGLEHALAQRFAIVNVWSALAPVKRDPLGMVEWSTVLPRDVQCVVRRVATDGVEEQRARETYRGLHSPKHRSLRIIRGTTSNPNAVLIIIIRSPAPQSRGG